MMLLLLLFLLLLSSLKLDRQHRAGGRPGNPSLSCGRLTNHNERTRVRRHLEGSRIAPHQTRHWAFDIEPVTSRYDCTQRHDLHEEEDSGPSLPIGGEQQNQSVGTGGKAQCI